MINKPFNVQIAVEFYFITKDLKLWTLQIVEIIEMFLELKQNLFGVFFLSLFLLLATKIIFKLKPKQTLAMTSSIDSLEQPIAVFLIGA